MHNENLKELLAQWKIPANLVKAWTPREQEELYASAYGLYDVDQYEEASNLFLQLIFSDTFQGKYWKGLAAARQMQRKYQEALQAWCIVALFAEEDPVPHFHAAECLLSLNEKEEGLKALKNAEELLKDDPELKRKIDLLRERNSHG
jgi:type III secretion system low calcium response chaperone LcrH/SycD